MEKVEAITNRGQEKKQRERVKGKKVKRKRRSKSYGTVMTFRDMDP